MADERNATPLANIRSKGVPCLRKQHPTRHSLLIKHHALKTYWGSEGIAPYILNLGANWRWAVSFTPRPSYLEGKSFRYPLGGRMAETQGRYG